MEKLTCLQALMFSLFWRDSGVLSFNIEETECPGSSDRQVFQRHVEWGASFRAYKTLPPGYRISTSGIEDAGAGVFSETFVPKYSWLGEYEGVPRPICDKEDDEKDCTNPETGCDYAWTIHEEGKGTIFVDAGDVRTSNWLRFINCARTYEEQNVDSHECRGKLLYKTMRDIHPGQELLVYYGDDYARELGIDIQNF